ncbi:hypothetical protein Tco_0730680 [Tanacetum coccineum]|uniref:Uncharacterized protein n=1 Tax=Tanacetum coccineum TaxID=301880 RepID=A0ABQ4YSG6_9ASTR
MIEDCCYWLVNELLDRGASRSMVVDKGEPAMSIARGATDTGTGETALYGGLNTQNFTDKVHELRAAPYHIFRASGVWIPENNLDNLSLTREEEDGTSIALDPQE